MVNEEVLSFSAYNSSDDALLSKIIGYLNAIIETSQNSMLEMSVLLPQINLLISNHSDSSNTQLCVPRDNTLSNTIAKHEEIRMNALEYMQDWENKEILEYNKKLDNAGFRLLCLCAMAGSVTAMAYAFPELGIGCILVVPPLIGIFWYSLLGFLCGTDILNINLPEIDFNLAAGFARVDSNHKRDSEKFFNKKKEVLNDYLVNCTSENPSENIVNKIESRIVRASVLTHYKSNAYTSYKDYREGRQLLNTIVAPSQPLVNVKTLTEEIHKLKRN